MVDLLLGKIATYILNPIIILGFVVATIYFFYSIVLLISQADSTKLEENKTSVIYGIVGLLIMFSVYGILRFVLATLNLTSECKVFFC